MKLTVNVHLNRIPESYKIFDDFEKARQYNLKHGVEVEFIFNKTDLRGYTSYYNPTIRRWLITGAYELCVKNKISDVEMFVFDENEWANPPGSQFPLQPNTPNGSCQLMFGKPFVCVGTYITDHENGQNWIEIAHELVHALAEIANLHDFGVIDTLDTYDHNFDPDYPTGNFAVMWSKLQNFIQSQDPVVLTRTNDDGVQTTGWLKVGNLFTCVTLERPWKNNLPNISCIPKGIYDVKWTFSARLLRYTYEVQKVPGRKGIRFHKGNYFFDVDGCILLGKNFIDLNHDGKLDVTNSTITTNVFEKLMNKKSFRLQII